MNIPAIARDIGRVSISLSKLMAALQLVQMFGIDGEEHAFIEQFEHILDGQAVDPGVEDASAAPAAPLLAAQLYILDGRAGGHVHTHTDCGREVKLRADSLRGGAVDDFPNRRSDCRRAYRKLLNRDDLALGAFAAELNDDVDDRAGIVDRLAARETEARLHDHQRELLEGSAGRIRVNRAE